MSNILKYNKVKTRKPHVCFGCNKKYPKGCELTYVTYANENTVFNCYWCDTCLEYMKKYKIDEIYYKGEIWDNDRKGWEKLKEEENENV